MPDNKRLDLTAATEVVATKPEVAWGGIGGSGRHAADIMAELVNQPRVARALDELASQRGVVDLIRAQPQVAWGGIGGSGRHAADLTPEEIIK